MAQIRGAKGKYVRGSGSYSIAWQGPALLNKIARQATAALTEFDLRVETEAKKELYPGHGKVTGTLQRAIQGEPAFRRGMRIKGRVSVKGVPYAIRIHKRYAYIAEGLRRTWPQTEDILKKHIKP